MSVVHQGMPAMPMLRPARTCRRSESQVAGMSPDQTAAEYRCCPAQAERQSSTVSASSGELAAAAMPSANRRALSRG